MRCDVVVVGIPAESIDPSIVGVVPCQTGVCGVHGIGSDGQALRQTGHSYRSGLDRGSAQRYFATIALGLFDFCTIISYHNNLIWMSYRWIGTQTMALDRETESCCIILWWCHLCLTNIYTNQQFIKPSFRLWINRILKVKRRVAHSHHIQKFIGSVNRITQFVHFEWSSELPIDSSGSSERWLHQQLTMSRTYLIPFWLYYTFFMNSPFYQSILLDRRWDIWILGISWSDA